MELQQCAEKPGNISGRFYTTLKSGLSINAQVATIDWFPSVASYYSLGWRLYYSVLAKHGRLLLGSLEIRTSDIFASVIPEPNLRTLTKRLKGL